MTFVARWMKLDFNTLDTKGKLRDALRLHSITLMSLSRARNCMLNGPLILSLDAISREIFLIRLTVSTYSFCGGNSMVASPEWTPANSTCSVIA